MICLTISRVCPFATGLLALSLAACNGGPPAPQAQSSASPEAAAEFSEIVNAHEILMDAYGGRADSQNLLRGAWDEANRYFEEASHKPPHLADPDLSGESAVAAEGLRAALVRLAGQDDDVDPHGLAAAALNGMAKAVGDAATYAGYAPLELYDLGLSAMWRPGFGGALIYELEPGGAAERAGFLMGDGIRTDFGFDTVKGLAGGRQPGFRASFYADRARFGPTPTYISGSASFRGNADNPAFSIRKLDDGSAHVRLHAIPNGPDFPARFEAALRKMAAENPTGWILDLRGNAGGSVENMAAVAALFGYQGHIAVVTPPGGQREWTLDAPPLHSVRGGKNLIVLMDYDTLANAEVLAVALREQNLAWLLGDFTCGWSAVSHRYALGGLLLTVSAGQARIGPKEVVVGPKGQVPDHWINLKRAQLNEGRDNQLEDAQIDVTRLPVRDGRSTHE